ncbi:metallophosphoesterase [Salipaludibacillus aurantiacus]|uniref:Calcineurin-like phosphoesterase domain-containing protein n=1 Tax=Salipaludibacillus aurantiacus TaxID=1601833 RepID=A0A1H9VQ23_9BACI|nr:metallophosphoesterase [Salipaludibacillus aurantiacus]SES23890.1 hypothetical protein SAMN05518684_11217 [Salipaludibacillus aurantiacus]
MNIRLLLSLGFFILTYTALNSYIGWNVYKFLEAAGDFNRPWTLAILIGLLSYTYMLGYRLKSFPLLKNIGSCWMAFFHFAIFIFPVVNLVVWLLGFAGLSGEGVIVTAGYATLILFSVYTGTGLFNAYMPAVKEYKLTVDHPQAHDGALRIAVASDMHFGGLSGKKHAERLVSTINRMEADLILFPGDLVDDDPDLFKEKKMDRTLKKLNARLGIYAVLGNHEYYGGKINELTRIMDDTGVNILKDEIIKLDSTAYIIGRKDKTDRNRLPAGDLLNTAGNDLPKLIMDHQPVDIHSIKENNAEMLFCGHTHKGQIFPYQWVTRRLFDVDYGYKQIDQLHVFVSSGFGFWGPPVRIGSRSEVMKIDVTFTGSQNYCSEKKM